MLKLTIKTLWTYFTSSSSVSIADFEQVNIRWVSACQITQLRKYINRYHYKVYMSYWPIRVEVRVLQFLEHELVSFASIWRPKVILK